MGLTPDLTEGLSDQAKKKLVAERDRAGRARKLRNEVASIEDVFSDPMFQSKQVPVGSEEDRTMSVQSRLRRTGVRELDVRDILGHAGRSR